MAAPKPSTVTTVTRISSQRHPILVTVDTFHPGLCHEGIEGATVTRIAFLSGPLPVAVDPRKEHDDDEEEDDDEDDDDDDDDDDDFETPRATQTPHQTTPQGGGGTESRPKPRSTPHHRGGGTPSRPKSRTTPHHRGKGPGGEGVRVPTIVGVRYRGGARPNRD